MSQLQQQQQFKVKFHCSFCDEDDERVLTQDESNRVYECDECFRKLTVLETIPINTNGGIQPRSPLQSNDIANEAITSILTGIANSLTPNNTTNTTNTQQPPLTREDLIIRQRNAFRQILQNAMEFDALNGAGGGDDGFGIEGCADEFINFLEQTQKIMTLYEYYKVAIIANKSNTLLYPTIGEFGININDIIDCLDFNNKQNIQHNNNNDIIDNSGDNHDGGDDNKDKSIKEPHLTPQQQSILKYFLFDTYDETTPTITNSNNHIDIPEGSILLYSSQLFQPIPITGKGLDKTTYLEQYKDFLSQIQSKCSSNTATSTTDDDNDRSKQLLPPIHMFQRGDISFALKSKLLPSNFTSKNDQNNPDTTTNTTDNQLNNSNQSLSNAPVMIVHDTNSVWPFIMSDSTKTAQNTHLSLLLSRQDAQQLDLVSYNPLLTTKNQQVEEQTTSKCPEILSMDVILVPNEQYLCSICQCQFECDDKYVRLACKHYFHHACLLQWVKKKSTCPICRFKLPSKLANGSDQGNDGGDDGDAGRSVARYSNFFM